MLHGIVNGTSGVFLLSSGIQGIASFLNGDICALSSDGYHYADSLLNGHVGEGKDGAKYAEAICKFCGEHFLCYASDIPAAYDDYVETLPATGYSSSGGLLWSPDYSAFLTVFSIGTNRNYYCSHQEGSVYRISALGSYTYTCGCKNNGYFSLSLISGESSRYLSEFDYYFSGSAPVSGVYTRQSGPGLSFSYGSSGGGLEHKSKLFSSGTETFYSQGTNISTSIAVPVNCSVGVLTGSCALPVYSVVPDTALSSDVYNINTRPTSITGGNYGIVGDNGQITKVEDNSTIVNETNNTFYNPATGQTVPITGWSYDYSDRSYKVTLESGDTVTVTYGDENITIQEGDTVYNVYYLVDGSGNPPCEHDWQEGEATVPTCVRPGSASYVCSLCGQTKTESIPALGHNWQVKQTVTTQYDDTGQLVQAGYTIFECSTCHEQYKSTDGTIPPGGGSGTDPGGEEGETIWDKLGNLIGAIGGGVIGLIDAALGKVLDALIVLAEKMMEKLKVVVETVLSIFDELPLLFGGFLDFLAAVFPFLPPEIMTILTFGVIAVVFIAIIKAVRR